jgi:hypothetical protein
MHNGWTKVAATCCSARTSPARDALVTTRNTGTHQLPYRLQATGYNPCRDIKVELPRTAQTKAADDKICKCHCPWQRLGIIR